MNCKKGVKIKNKIKPNELPTVKDLVDNLPNQPFWNIKHYTFIQIYRECLDEKEAAKSAGLNKEELQRALQDPKIKIALEDAKDDFIQALSLTPKKGAKKFLEVYNKIENRFDEGESKVATALANMAATFLKATGQLNSNEENTPTKVSINISLSNNKPIEKVIAKENEINVNLTN